MNSLSPIWESDSFILVLAQDSLGAQDTSWSSRFSKAS
jgi:hypothetical protein